MKNNLCFKTILLLNFLFILGQSPVFSQETKRDKALLLFQAAQKDQKSLKWQASLAKFKQLISDFPQSPYAQKAHIEIGKFYKYHRDWPKAIEQYHQAVAIAPGSRPAQDALTAEAAVYYYRQDFPSALAIFKEVLKETKDWDQLKYCSYWLKELRRKMSFAQEETFSCGPEALRIAFDILGIRPDKKGFASLFKAKDRQVSLLELTKVAAANGLKPKVVKVSSAEAQNLNTPFIALVNPEHYVVVTGLKKSKVRFIDPAHKRAIQISSLAEFAKDFKGYALIFLEENKIAQVPESELKELKGGICDCCPPSNLGGPGNNPNVEYDDKEPCSPGMPSWMVNTVNLNLVIQDIDFSYASRGMPIEFIRTYNADDPREGIFGRSWTFNYNIALVENPDTSIDIRRGDGRVDHFFWNGTRYQGPEGIYDTLTKNADATYSLKLKKDKSTQNFDSQGRLLNIKDRNNNILTFTYDVEGKLTNIADPNARNIILIYGPNAKVSRISLPDGRYASFFYDANNNLIQSVDMKGAIAAFTYDSASYITTMTTPHQGTTTFNYYLSSEGYAIKSITNALGNSRAYEELYDESSQVKILDSRNHAIAYASTYNGYTQGITTPQGNSITFEYDWFGNRTKIKDTRGNTTSLTYDARGNITSITDALNNQITLAYDSDDNLSSSTDPQSHTYSFGYDTNSNLTEVIDPDSQTTTFDYNSYGQLRHIYDANGGVTEFIYNTQGNLTEMISPLGKHTYYDYDTLGRLTSLTDPKGQGFSYTYDGVDHLTQVTHPDTTSTIYTYNCCNLLQVQGPNGALNFTYDALGRLKTFTNSDNKVVSYDYDSEGNLTTLTYPDNKQVIYEYDADNRLTKVTDWLVNVTNYNYDSRGNLSFTVSPGLITIYKYDEANRLRKLINYNSQTFAITSAFEFTLDSLGNRASIQRHLPLALPEFNLASSTYAYNSDNQLTSANEQTFSYDDNGNMLQRLSPQGVPEATYTYNYDNQLTNYTSGSTNLSYLYDALANRIQKTSSATTTKYILDPNRALPSVLAETDPSGNITCYYVYGLGLISKIEGSSAYFYQYDGLGSTVAITDSSGSLKNTYAYDDFGNLATNSTETIANPFKYVGRYGVMTDLPDLLYMRARYYDPSVGRFTSKDPIGLAGGLNLYGYVGGNAINAIDPMGLQGWEENAIKAAIAIALAEPTPVGEIIVATVAAYAVYQINKGLGPESYPGAKKAKISQCKFPPLAQGKSQFPGPKPPGWWQRFLEKLADLLGEFQD